ncbi:damage-control phosphatase ARMT1-like isoform X1 [Dromiciops gliroides]|uniref:damage-control phosphatase ARMT1-like isoform X1 n=2 Tax=Dromiciops gliroides TaxID=33562 RepID=UPI001CC45E4B|nr:damage-control phosphatase ARMT1-like isoform X1 [Dromiciops gliroides]
MDELPPRMTPEEEGSFPYLRIKDQTPPILTKAIDALHRHKSEFFEKHGEEGTEAEKKAISLLSKLRNELQTDKPFLPLTDNCVDTDTWNQYLEYHHSLLNGNNKKISWFHSPWLYVECYMYRRVHEALMLSSPISYFDVFKESKHQNFFESQEAIKSLCNYLQELKKGMENLDENQLKDEFFKLLQIMLWGNKCDLAISPDQSVPQTSSPLASLEDLKPFIVVNNTDYLWSLLIKRKKMSQETFSATRVDFIMDNAGFELVADLVMADFLLASKLVTEIHFHGKSIPWFVSDTNKNDMDWLIKQLKAANIKCMSECGVNWEHYLKHTWIYQDHMFWTLPHEYCTMAQVAPDLYAELQKSNLILFKGDLNYRKLVADRKWEFTVPFHQALNGFHPAPLCSLRTVKTGVQVGLEPGQGEQLALSDPNWMTSGKYGIFQFDGSV